MTSPEIALFLWINAGPQTPAATLWLARFASDWLPALAVTVLLATAAVRPRARDACAQTLLALLLAWILARLAREALGLPRPAALGIGTQWIAHAAGPGMPSLHATCAFAFAFALSSARERGIVPLAAFAVALLVAWSRLLLGVHFPADVLAGAVVGAFAARSSAVLWTLARRLRVRTSPAPAGP